MPVRPTEQGRSCTATTTARTVTTRQSTAFCIVRSCCRLHAPERLRDRETLWNEVEKAERRKDAQLAYSFDIALQNELSFEENLELAKQFLQENFVAAGMIVDFAIHDPERNGAQNPHFHVMAPIRPLNPDGTWGAKQRMVYRLDEDGQRLRKSNGKYAVDAVPTTDWGRPETLDRWREAWADLVNQKLDEKELDCRIDHRSYAEPGSGSPANSPRGRGGSADGAAGNPHRKR